MYRSDWPSSRCSIALRSRSCCIARKTLFLSEFMWFSPDDARSSLENTAGLCLYSAFDIDIPCDARRVLCRGSNDTEKIQPEFGYVKSLFRPLSPTAATSCPRGFQRLSQRLSKTAQCIQSRIHRAVMKNVPPHGPSCHPTPLLHPLHNAA
jgi:hypothetical protein